MKTLVRALAVSPFILCSSLCTSRPLHWVSCERAPSNLLAITNDPDAWPVGELVDVEGFVTSVAAGGAGTDGLSRAVITVQSVEGTAEVAVVAPVHADVSGFAADHVRVQGLAGMLHGAPAVLLQQGEDTVGAVVACPAMHAIMRTLEEAGTIPCGQFVADRDLVGGDLPAPRTFSASNEECLERCMATPDCNASMRLDDGIADGGLCFLKNVPADLPTISNPTRTSYIICPEASVATTSPAPPTTEVPAPVDAPTTTAAPATPPPGGPDSIPCGQFVADRDLVGGDLPAPLTFSASNEECLERCMATPDCNASMRLDDGIQEGGGLCFLKNVPADFPTISNPTRTSYIICSGASVAPPTSSSPTGGTASQGKWGSIINFPLVPVAAVALPNGQVLVWSGANIDDYPHGEPGLTFYAIYNPASNSVGALQSINLDHDMFCPGISMLPNGDVLVAGGSAGEDGAGSTSIWTGSTFVKGPPLNTNRGYNSAVTLDHGDVFTLGGSFSGGLETDKGGEYYPTSSMGPWRPTTGIMAGPILSDDPQGAFRTDNYPLLFAWTGGSVFHAGPSTQMNWFTNLADAGTVTPAGSRGPTAMNGNAVMYAAGKILAVGGALSYSMGHPARSGAEVITLGAVGEPPSVKLVAGPKTARTYANGVVLPTGEVGLFGGATTAVEFSDGTAVLQAEIWSPATETFRVDASAAVPRTYHSSAVLVPDGRVLVGGGGLCVSNCGVNHLDAEMYSPAYLFNADSSPAARPQISLNTQNTSPGGAVTVTASEALSMVSMVRMGGATHSTNTDQRRLELCGPSTTPCGGAVVSVQVPAAGIAIPGPWMVFGLNQAGVPSVAQILVV